MSETSHPGHEHGPARPAMQYTVPELATLRGISQQAVLAQIARGDVLAIDTESGWIIYVDFLEPPAGQQVTAQERPSHLSTDEVVTETYVHHPPATHADGPMSEPALPIPVAVPISPVDLTLLVNLVSDLTRRNAELLDSTATWRERVQELEQQLLQLSSGEPASPANSGSRGSGITSISKSSNAVETGRSARPASDDRARSGATPGASVDPKLIAALFRGPAGDSAPGQLEPVLHPAAKPWWRPLVRRR